jgi:uridylate kinase
MKVAIKLGGSLLTKQLDSKNFKKYVDILIKMKKEGHKIVVVTGGGITARNYQNIARSMGVRSVALDNIGIAATKLTAMTLIACLGRHAYHSLIIYPPWIHRKFGWLKRKFDKQILVCGALRPGESTDYDLVNYAKIVGADLVIKASDVDGVYSADPKKYKNAKKLSKLTYDQFIKIISKNEQTPGKYRLFDMKAAKAVKEWKLKTVIINGTRPMEILNAVNGNHHGTVIS